MSDALIQIVKKCDAAYGISYGEDALHNPTEVHVFARWDAAEALAPLLQEFERLWEASDNDGKVLKFALAVESR